MTKMSVSCLTNYIVKKKAKLNGKLGLEKLKSKLNVYVHFWFPEVVFLVGLLSSLTRSCLLMLVNSTAMLVHQQNQYWSFIEQNSLSSFLSLLPEISVEGSSVFVMQMVTSNGHVNRPIGTFSISQLFLLDNSDFRCRAYGDSFPGVVFNSPGDLESFI